MEFEIFDTMFTALDGALAGTIAAYTGVLGFIEGPLKVGITIYIVLLGIAILRGAVEYPFREFVYRALKLAALVVAVTSLYGTSVGLFAMSGLPSDVANAVGAQPASGLGGFFDQILQKAFVATTKIQEIVARETAEAGNTFGFPNNIDEIIIAGFLCIVIIVIALLASALGFAICAFALFALALLAAIGPIFVAALLFDSTRSFFFSWLGSIVNYVILVAFALLVTLFISNTGDLFVDAIRNDDPIYIAAAKALGFYILGFYFFLQIPGLAAGLGGGGASLATQFANAVVTAPVAGATKAAGSGAAFAARAAYNRMRGGSGGSLRNTSPGRP